MVEWLQTKKNYQNLAFGFLFIPEIQIFIGAVCKKNQVERVEKTEHINSKNTFVAFPFSGTGAVGFALPNTNPVEEDVERGPGPTIPPFEQTPKQVYLNQVEEAVALIQKGDVRKLVLSRKSTVEFPPDGIPEFIRLLTENQLGANLCLMNLPEMGFWVSATPEILLERNEEETELRTMALAGTVKNSGSSQWTNKERAEQGLVGDYIRETLTLCHLDLIEENGPNPIAAGMISHLRTDYRIRVNGKSDFDALAYQLHPTPAVGGIPKEKTLDLIRSLEGFDRQMYSGFAGIRQAGFSRFVVLLRIGKIENNSITLYAGAGITADSEAEKEWLETEEKLKTLQRWIPW